MTALACATAEPAPHAAVRPGETRGTPSEPGFDRLLRLAAHRFATPFAFVSLLDGGRHRVKGAIGLAATDIAPEGALCEQARRGSGILVVADAPRDARFAADPLVRAAPGIRFYAAAPLITAAGAWLGTLSIADTAARPPLGTAEIEDLAALAALALEQVELRRANVALDQADRDLASMLDAVDQREAALTQALATAQAASRAKSDFLATMSHELRTPLNAVIGFAEIMRAGMFGQLGERYAGYIGDIHASAVHLLHLINDVLDISKIEANAMKLQIDEASPSLIAASVVRLMKARAEKAGLTLEHVDGTAGLTARLDQRALRQILLNLVSNAVKFSNPGGRIVIETGRRDDAMLFFTVSDEGIGMSEEEIVAALQPFQQLDSGLARRYEGTGLGLPIAERLVALHGGRLEIASRRGEGTRVTALLPDESRAAA